jgi:hypothetical protein
MAERHTGFSKNTYPNLYHSPSVGTEYKAVHRGIMQPSKDLVPARDNRYPAYYASMSDARLVTDYRSQCSKNITPHHQFYTKRWMIEHATDMMTESRRRQLEGSGASLPLANTTPPPAQRVYLTRFTSDIEPTYLHNGIGIERVNTVPELFGTFQYDSTLSEIRKNRKNIQLNTKYEGGRNSIRGSNQTEKVR